MKRGDHFETRHRRKDGTLFDVEISTNGAFQEDEKLVFCVCRDITERKHAEESLRQSEERYRTILEIAMDGFCLVDSTGRLLQVNYAYCEMTGYTEQELLSMKLNDLESVETEDSTASHMQKIISEGKDRFETRHRRKDGSLFDVEVSVQYSDVHGGLFAAFLRDISKRIKSETKLRYHAALTKQISDAVIATDLDLNITAWNLAAESIYGWSAHEAQGRHIDELLQTDWFDQGLDDAQKMLGETGRWRGEVRQRSKGGRTLVIEASVSWIYNQDGAAIGGVTVNRDITERKNAEIMLRISEERYRSFIQQTSEGVYLLMLEEPVDVSLPIDDQVDALYDQAYMAECNDAFAQMYGLKSGSELLNKTLIEFHGGKDHPVNRAEVRKFVECGYNVVDEETEETGAEGETRWFSNSTVGIVENGMLIRMWGTQTDITDRKKAIRIVEESEVRYRGIVSVLPDLLFCIDAELRFTDVQTSVPEMLLAPADEIVGKTAWDVLPPDIARLTDEKVRATLEGGKMQVYNYALDMRGVTKECETRMVPCGKGEVLAIVRDITERKRIEENLATEHATLQAIFNASPDILVLKDTDLVYQRVNLAFCNFIGKESTDIIGRTDYDLFPKEDALQYVAGDVEVFETGIPEDKEWQVLGYKDRRWLEVIKTAVCDADGKPFGILCTGRDVTEYHRLENLLIVATQREQENLARELHDGLCQDLKGLEFQAALLEKRVAANNSQVKEIVLALSSGINLAVRRAYEITQGMLPIDLIPTNFIEALSALTSRMACHTATQFTLNLEKNLIPKNHSQTHQLYRIAQEALINALRHSHATKITLSWRKENGEMQLSIQDNGIGIDHKKNEPQWGLGLHVMFSRAQTINARLTVHNLENGGTEVLVRLIDD